MRCVLILPLVLWIAMQADGVHGDETESEAPAPELKSDREYSTSERSQWSFQSVTKPDVPTFDDAVNSAWIRTPVDAFVLKKLHEQGFAPSSEADRRVLIRRLYYDLLGLPPSPEAVADFANDDRSDAYARLVDRLLGNPHYGERWGQHWLDLVRFAESEGYEYDRHMPEAWQYRDYVIAAFNANKPYDEFVAEQLAGDELVGDIEVASIDERDRARLNAAGLNRIASIRRNAGNSFVVFSRNEVLTEMTDIVGSALLGLTVGCARCHDHMFDPIRQRDYYHLQSFFSATHSHDLVLADEDAKQLFKAANQEVDAKVEDLKQQLANVSGTEKDELVARLEALEEERPEPLPAVFTVHNAREEQSTIHLLKRGDERRPIGEPLGLRVPGVFLPDGAAEWPADIANPRTRLAKWLTDPEHPLTARVMVNRIWLYHFGRGIVDTPNDFGLNGTTPTHPELLDWLAAEFVQSGWDIHHVHRLILLSSTYRQSSRVNDAHAADVDPQNRWLWRFHRRRLDAEEIRDSMLVMSGRFNDKAGGPSVIVPVEEELVNLLYKPSQWAVTPDKHQHDRRSIYLMAKRNLRLPFMEVFDQPDFQTSCPSRVASTHSRQALELLNGPLSNDLAKSFADRLERESGESNAAKIELAFRIVAGRAPSPREMQRSLAFLEESALVEFALAMFNMNAFIYVE